MLHEVTHQLFQESKKVPPRRGGARQHLGHRGRGLLHGVDPPPGRRARGAGGLGSAARATAACRRRSSGDWSTATTCRWPSWSTLGTTDLQRRPDLPQLYSQSAGLAAFFMQHEDGKYRRAFVEYLGRIYAGRDNPQTLSQLTGRSYTQLDAEYEQFLHEAARQLQSEPRPAQAPPGP